MGGETVPCSGHRPHANGRAPSTLTENWVADLHLAHWSPAGLEPAVAASTSTTGDTQHVMAARPDTMPMRIPARMGRSTRRGILARGAAFGSLLKCDLRHATLGFGIGS